VHHHQQQRKRQIQQNLHPRQVAVRAAVVTSYWTLGNKALAKEPGWIPAYLGLPSDERKEEVYGPGSSSSNSSDHVSHKEEEDVHHSKEDMAPVDVVEVVDTVSGAFYPFFGLNTYLYLFICYVVNFTGQLQRSTF
jgi:hypothetical protein